MYLVVFEGAEHLLGETRLVDVVDLHEEDGVVAADAEVPQVALRELVLGQQFLPLVAEGGRLEDVFRDAVVEPHLRTFQKRHVGAHVVVNRGFLESILDVDSAGIGLKQLGNLVFRLGEAGDQEGGDGLAGGEVESATHAHDGVEGGTDGVAQRAVVVDDVGMADAAAAAEEAHA